MTGAFEFDMNTTMKIYAMTHKKFDANKLKGSIYEPLFVGSSDKDETYGYLRDDTGINISHKNCYYSELTGIYWIYKNVKDIDIVGTCHYRRYLVDDNDSILNADDIKRILSDYDVITSKMLKLNYSYYYGFGENHKPYYLDNTREVIRDLYPSYLSDYDRLVGGKHTYFGNIMICSKKLFDKYATWLFDILFELENRIVIEESDSYHRRIFGFISEFLLFLWVRHNNVISKELKVGIVGEKIEIRTVRTRIGEFFAKGDVAGAKAYFLEEREKRPDLLMEASDITGELHICMEAIAIASLEQEEGLDDIISTMRDYESIIKYCSELNENIIGNRDYTSDLYSYVAVEVVRRMYYNTEHSA